MQGITISADQTWRTASDAALRLPNTSDPYLVREILMRRSQPHESRTSESMRSDSLVALCCVQIVQIFQVTRAFVESAQQQTTDATDQTDNQMIERSR